MPRNREAPACRRRDRGVLPEGVRSRGDGRRRHRGRAGLQRSRRRAKARAPRGALEARAAQRVRSMAERRAAIQAACDQVVLTRALLEKAKIPCPVVTGAGSGSFMFEVESGAWNEIQPGSYVFMDADYARNEWAAPLPRFEHSLFVLATVMSRPAADRAIVDAGLKASSVDSGMPSVWQNPGLTYAAASDEHGRVDIEPGAAAPALGEKLLLVPGHCDPTVNLYDWYVCARKGVVEALWPITARGASL